jgi:hypothetical protein
LKPKPVASLRGDVLRITETFQHVANLCLCFVGKLSQTLADVFLDLSHDLVTPIRREVSH